MELTTFLHMLIGALFTLFSLMIYEKLKNKSNYYEEANLHDILLNHDELKKHAQELAQNHYIMRDTKLNYMLIPRMNKSYNYIKFVYKNINLAERTQSISQDAEWLLDNFYIIEEQVKEIRKSLSKGYYSGLPGLKNSILKGYPRVYAIAMELVSHTDGKIDEDTIIDFINAYQSKSLLSSGELWALGLMIKIALIENIKKSSEKITITQKQWSKADEVANIIFSNKNMTFDDIKKLIHDKVMTIGKIPTSFFERLLQRIRMEGDDSTVIVQYIDRILQEYDTNIADIVELDHQILAARQVSIGNAITSLKYVSTLDWSQIFEKLSNVEQILRQDPDGTYEMMDFESRDYYRHQIEEIAKRYKTSETFVARKALECAREVLNDNNKPEYINHVGFYIIGKGRSILESKIGHKKNSVKVMRVVKSHIAIFYIASIVALTIFASAALWALLIFNGLAAIYAFILAAISIIPISEFVIQAVNWAIIHIKRPTIIPKIELKNGIPKEAATMVIVPVLLTSVKRVKELLAQLEITYISNKEDNLYFAIVGDFKDTNKEKLEDDEEIVNTALGGIKELNEKYGEGKDIFFYFHRKRVYCQTQNAYMGWERKRGAIVEFNELLMGSNDTSFYVKSANVEELPRIKYVITLDADTNLIMDTAKRLIGTMMHPLNKAVVDSEKNVVVEGYGLLQPRIGVDILSSSATVFSSIFAGNGGIDPYTTAVSDVYQDLFGEGIFTGKGIYDVEVFRTILKDLIPDNSILSHDLLEGSFIRAGLVTDILLIDGFPSKYNSYMMRMHRWVRGDWQLLPYLSRRIKTRQGNYMENPLSIISKWKIIDNLRRSLVAPFALALLLLSNLVPYKSFVMYGVVILALFEPFIAAAIDAVLEKSKEMSNHSILLANSLKNTFYASLLQFAFLPYQGYLMIDAVVRTIYRVYVSRKNLLEWVTAADMERQLKNDFISFLKRMLVSIPIGAILILVSMYFKRDMLPYSILISLIWFASPYIAYRISSPIVEREFMMEESDIKELRKLSRKIWRYFEDFVTENDNYLPPDNFQLDPYAGIARRTSPTNIGLYLTSTISARDFGYITTSEMVDRIDKTVSTIEKMEKWHGHLYNWYKTDDLEPLKPYYISTVDSGNLVGYMIALKEGLKKVPDMPLTEKLSAGLSDLIEIVNDELKSKKIKYEMLEGDYTIEDWHRSLNQLRDGLSSIKFNDDDGWYMKIVETIDSDIKELDELVPFYNYDEYEQMFELNKDTTLNNLKAMYEKILEMPSSNREKFIKPYENVKHLIEKVEDLIIRLNILIEKTEFRPLFDEKRQLFSIGYNIEDEKLTKSYYDLFASEARQASFIAIAKKEVDAKHWFRMGRMVTGENAHRGLISWSGTMFEYFMPLLIMKNFKNTILDQTYKFVVMMQKKYAKKYSIPWGISESGFYSFDIKLNYQYKAFGVPWLGLKRGLSRDVVIAPYGAILSLRVDPKSVVENIKRLKDLGVEGKYGLYEAVDFTPERIPYGKKYAIVKSFMSHHLGMSMLALNNFINKNVMQERFHSDPYIKSVEILLQEKVPNGPMILREEVEAQKEFEEQKKEEVKAVRVVEEIDDILPQVHILSNGDYSVVLTDRGTGYSKKEGINITRWKNSLDEIHGTFIFVQNVNSNTTWSTTYAPFFAKDEKYKVVFKQDMAKFIKKVGNIDTETEVIVSPEDDVEIRRVTLKNHSEHDRVLEVTSYFEPVLSDINADIAHPAFNKLFIKTEILFDSDMIVANRRPRDLKKSYLWVAHAVYVDGGETVGDTQFETDRAKFIGRGRTLRNPVALETDRPLSNSDGSVLDPIMSLRKRIKLDPNETVKVVYITSVAESKAEAVKLANKYKNGSATERAFEMSVSRGKVELDYLNLKSDELGLFQKMLPHIVFSSPVRIAKKDTILKNQKGQSGLWAYGISGDIPIVLLEICKKEELPVLKKLLKAHEYWRMKGLYVDLVILNNDKGGYIDALGDRIKDVINGSFAYNIMGQFGGVFLINRSSLKEEDYILLNTVAKLSLTADMPIEKQLEYDDIEKNKKAKLLHIDENNKKKTYPVPLRENLQLHYSNGYGGFSLDGHKYVINLDDDKVTPMPWINVVSNYKFGFQVSESGSGFSWAENSREYKITPWSNDPVLDEGGEILYLRDDFTGEYWTITPKPLRDKGQYVIEHGFGYSLFKHGCSGINHEMLEFVPMNDTVKISLVKLKNVSGEKRRLSLYYFIKPVLGVSESITSPYVVTEMNEEIDGLLIRNVYNEDFKDRISFISSSVKVQSYTGNLSEFLGSDFDTKRPEALKMESLSNNVGIGLSPCAAIQVVVELEENEEKELSFLLGTGMSLDDVRRIMSYYKNINNVKEALNYVNTFWNNFVGTINVATPDKSFDLLLNGWLLYQTISCRIWARSAFYQSGGAYGFRDQLQDTMNVVYVAPELTRAQILNACAHQFKEGDVLHWWHPVTDKGIRTKYSDDLLWLPYAVADYVSVTDDTKILDIQIPFLNEEPLKDDEDERYGRPKVSDETATVYEHCIRAIEHSLKFGQHGIPLMGSGDWNDGMNMVGNKGKGESVWLGWFMYVTLKKFSKICIEKNDHERCEKYEEVANDIIKSIEEYGWDGSWYRRAYFDNGIPLGSSQNNECKIDSIAQSWAAISGAAKWDRVKEALDALENYLVDYDNAIIKLLSPPFDKGDLNPGYIKGYVPGVRENGGQYTHAAIWAIMAYAMIGDGDKAYRLYSMINPINHTRTLIENSRYKVEPYVMAADVYAVEPNTGRGGWTWYTGSSGWMYRVGIEHILGFKKEGDAIVINPCVPKDWAKYKIEYMYKNDTKYIIEVENPEMVNRGVREVSVDGNVVDDNKFILKDDGKIHHVFVVMGTRVSVKA
ncbi:glycosyltransferase 36 [Thermoanaerobacterium xylanolyticum LX-11]|uniref:Glycosyltransferase 36 n=2 Tax=Thermoanaerobacterium xylanolyticum TaxID=29329 RepID=F6BH47_THEXL|nr:glycosyltransferase 36 [Thermoanaerobacterium xylanolyticum LX-11]